MRNDDRDNVFAIAAFATLAVALVAGMVWHARITDRALARHFECVDAGKADGLTTRQAHHACVAKGEGHE